MKNRRFLHTIILIALITTGCVSTPVPMPRPGPPATGSARWGYAIAEPSISVFAPDAQLYEISGTYVYRDGRLPSNMGEWNFYTWSPVLRQTFQVTVKFDGTISTTTRNENTAPSQNGQPLPLTWADSTTVFAAAAPYLKCGVTSAWLAALNVASYAEAPGEAVWGIKFDAGQNQLVKWDGAYVGPQGAPDVPCGSNLKSDFLKADVCANLVMSGSSYEMDDPNWLVNMSNQNRETCAYKFLSALHMLGYNTDLGGIGEPKPQLVLLQQFQSARGLPVTTLMTADTLMQLDALLVPREAKTAALSATFPLYSHMQPLHRNDVSKNWLAYIYTLPMSVLPAYLRMGDFETAQCIWGQCLGFLQDANGINLPCQQSGCFTTDLNANYFFAGAYFDPMKLNSRLPSAAADVRTVLHEYAHYLDGIIYARYPSLPHLGIIATSGYYNISYDMNQAQGSCAPRRSTNPQDWITKYGFNGSGGGCIQGKVDIREDWADSFSMYVADGKAFRAAAQQNGTIASKYSWLKANVFQGVEYDTDFQSDVDSGCNDVPGYQQSQPGYASCSATYIWDAELRIK